jgi:hypothetical protein
VVVGRLDDVHARCDRSDWDVPHLVGVQDALADLQRRLDAKDWALERMREKCTALEQKLPPDEPTTASPMRASGDAAELPVACRPPTTPA